jgi:hypothetical protein
MLILFNICAKLFLNPLSMTKMWARQDFITADIWLLGETLTLKLGNWVLKMTHSLIMLQIVTSYIKIPWYRTELRAVQCFLSADLWLLKATLTFEVGVYALRMTHHVIMLHICANLFYNPLIHGKEKPGKIFQQLTFDL